MKRKAIQAILTVVMNVRGVWGDLEYPILAQHTAFCSVPRELRLLRIQRFTTVQVTHREGLFSTKRATIHPNSKLHSHKKDSDDDPVVSIVQRVASIAATPLLGGTLKRPLALGYPLVLLASVFFLPPLTSLLLVITFGLFAWLGRYAIVEDHDFDKEEEEDQDSLSTDALALGAAGLTAGILAPMSMFSPGNIPLDIASVTVTVGLLSAIALLQNKTPSAQQDQIVGTQEPVINGAENVDAETEGDLSANEKRLMELWDQSFNNGRAKTDSKDDT
jgi:hypothetical protein